MIHYLRSPGPLGEVEQQFDTDVSGCPFGLIFIKQTFICLMKITPERYPETSADGTRKLFRNVCIKILLKAAITAQKNEDLFHDGNLNLRARIR